MQGKRQQEIDNAKQGRAFGRSFGLLLLSIEKEEKQMEVSDQLIAINSDWSQLPLILSIPEVAKILGVGSFTAYELAKQKGFPVIRLGRKLKVPRDKLRQWVER